MSDTIKMNSTSQARTSASTLSGDAKFYAQLVTDLKDAKTQISTNWEGSTNDIVDIITRITLVCNDFETRIIPSLEKLSSGVTTFADEVDLVAKARVAVGNVATAVTGAAQNVSNVFSSKSHSSSNEKSSENKGFWKTIGDDFKDDWDYSDTDGVLSAAGNTVQGLFNTYGSVQNTVGRVIGGIVGGILD